MELARDNNYSIADDTVLNVTSLMQCTDVQRLSLDEMSFGEFTSTNVPTLLKGSRATVNGALFGPAPSDGVPLYIANAAGSTFQDVSAAPADTTLYLCLVPGTDTATYALKACASVYYNAERRGWYETGSQVRVFGECRKVGGAWPVAYKRRYFHPSVAEAYLKMYSDGLEVDARKILPACSKGRLATAYSSTTAKDWISVETAQILKVRTDYPIQLDVVLTCKTAGGPPTGVAVTGCSVVVVALDDTTESEIGVFDEKTLLVPADTMAASDVTTIFNLPVGKFAVKIKAAVQSKTYYAATYGVIMHTDAIKVYPRNAVGNRVNEWGAVI